MVIRFTDISTEVRVSLKKMEAFPKAAHAFFSAAVLDKAGIRRTKTQLIGPLSAFRFMPDDPDAAKFAETHKVGLDMQRVVNTEALRRSTVPWPTGFGPVYTNAIDERGAKVDADELRTVIPKKAASKKAATTGKAKAPAKASGKAKAGKTAPRKRAAKPKDTVPATPEQVAVSA